MNTQQLSLLVVLGLMLLAGGALFLRASRGSRSSLSDLGRYQDEEEIQEEQDEEDRQAAEQQVEEWKKSKKKRHKEPTIDEKLFMAGRLSSGERLDFHRKRKLAPIVFGLVGGAVGVILFPWNTAVMCVLSGVIVGIYLPLKLLGGWVRDQHEEISYYLPLVIEQMAIGVSSSLDIGPCLTKIVEMADDRNSHNAVTRLLKYALMYVKSGVGFEEALSEVGRSSGHPEFKHAVLALSQVAKFGGEISKQLQDLADSVATQREAKIEATIRKLEIKATGPVALIFVAYMLIIFLGIAASALKSF